jgi:hypothetical protein
VNVRLELSVEGCLEPLWAPIACCCKHHLDKMWRCKRRDLVTECELFRQSFAQFGQGQSSASLHASEDDALSGKRCIE